MSRPGCHLQGGSQRSHTRALGLVGGGKAASAPSLSISFSLSILFCLSSVPIPLLQPQRKKSSQKRAGNRTRHCLSEQKPGMSTVLPRAVTPRGHGVCTRAIPKGNCRAAKARAVLSHGRTGWLTGWLTEWLTGWVTGWLTEWRRLLTELTYRGSYILAVWRSLEAYRSDILTDCSTVWGQV